MYPRKFLYYTSRRPRVLEVDRLGPLCKIHLLYKQLPYSLCIANASKVNSMPSSILVTPPPPPKKKKRRPCVCKNKKAWHLAPPIALLPFKNQLLSAE